MAQTAGLERSKTLVEQNLDLEDNVNSTKNESLPENSAEIFKSLDSNSDGHLHVTEVGIL